MYRAIKWIAIGLLLANLGFAGLTPGLTQWFDQRNAEDMQLLHQQLNPESIRLLTPQEVSALASGGILSPRAEGVPVCMEWGPVTESELPAARALVTPFNLGDRLVERDDVERTSHWLYMPTQGNRQLANQKAAELKQLGLEQFFIVQDDPAWRHAIHLGAFRSAEAAQIQLEKLRDKGVRSAQLGSRETSVKKWWFRVQDAEPALVSRLGELKAAMSATDVRECVPATRGDAARKSGRGEMP
jgi:hypothetical protein